MPGKQASLKILRGITLDSDALITAEAKQDWYYWVITLSMNRAHTNVHPNIHLLLDTIEQGLEWNVSIEREAD